MSLHPMRITQFLFSRRDEALYADIIKTFSTVESHFGYDHQSMLGLSSTDDRYLVLKELDEKMYSEVYPSLAEIRFLPEDFIQLEHDPSIDKLYSNGGADTWFIHALSSD